ncbi:ribosome assembly RNA-binding protein YhbY [Clostridium sp. 'deep sea']|uniref:ribosome assembly RNA-binding protein YhbY n=1 Tax=Clostridium sp. 'deep sea' TaxID=2779445 RepID=UPI00189681C8|nr:ribosome assembly RNA-binding protein YhbY [Clostridium sp. 'deep sea']QOR36450.1 ribosome assembly RNA-binding protein YhbY [Clostridium sp. 'deep sea']
MLTSKQRAYLRSLAHHLEPKLYIGKNFINDNLIKQADDYLTKNELMKCSVQQNIEADTKEIALELANSVNAEIAQVIGRKFVIFRRNNEDPIINLPSK